MNRLTDLRFLSLGVLALSLLACDAGRKDPKPVPQPPSDSSSTKPKLPEPIGTSPAEAADKGLAIFKDMSSHPETYAIAGFGSIEEVEKATLGAPFMTHWVQCKIVSSADQGTPLAEHILRTQATYPVLADNRLRSVIYVDGLPGKKDQVVEAKPGSDNWQVSGMGDAQLIAFFDTAAAYMPKDTNSRAKDILVKFPAAYLAFRASGLGENDYAIPLGASGKIPCFDGKQTPMTWPALRKRLSTCKQVMDACKENPQVGTSAPAPKGSEPKSAK
jgi:hypothetical protein